MVSALTGNADRDPSLLLLDYEMLRDDDRNLIGTQVQSFSIGIATLGLLGALVVRALDESKEHLPDFALVGAPLIPLSLFVYMVTMAPPSIIRSFYGRLLERQLHEHFAERKQADGASRYDSRLQFPSYFELSVGVQRLSRGSTTVRVFVALLALLVTLIFCGITAVLILKTDSLAIKLAAIPFYSVTVSAMVWHAIRLNIRGREYFYRQVEAFEEARRDRLLPVVKNVRERSLLSYLVFPRPADLAKWLFFPIGAVIAFSAAMRPLSRSVSSRCCSLSNTCCTRRGTRSTTSAGSARTCGRRSPAVGAGCRCRRACRRPSRHRCWWSRSGCMPPW